MAAIPEKYRDLVDTKAFAQLATLMPDGSPHVAISRSAATWSRSLKKELSITSISFSKKYTGQDFSYSEPGEVRVMYKIGPERSHTMG